MLFTVKSLVLVITSNSAIVTIQVRKSNTVNRKSKEDCCVSLWAYAGHKICTMHWLLFEQQKKAPPSTLYLDGQG